MTAINGVEITALLSDKVTDAIDTIQIISKMFLHTKGNASLPNKTTYTHTQSAPNNCLFAVVVPALQVGFCNAKHTELGCISILYSNCTKRHIGNKAATGSDVKKMSYDVWN